MIVTKIKEKIQALTKNNLHENRHLLDTEQKVLALLPNASNELRIAALWHDIDRAIPEERIHFKDYWDYEKYKKAHALKSAQIMYNILIDMWESKIFSQRVFDIIAHHERQHPTDTEINILMTADSLSFFDCNISDYEKTHTFEDTQKKINFMYNRMEPIGKEYLKENMLKIYEKYIK